MSRNLSESPERAPVYQRWVQPIEKVKKINGSPEGAMVRINDKLRMTNWGSSSVSMALFFLAKRMWYALGVYSD